MKIGYRRVDQKTIPPNDVLRREVVRLRDVEGLSWRKIAARLRDSGHPVSFQRVCQLYDKVKRQTGQVNRVKGKEVISKVKLKRNREMRTQELTPETIDELIKLDAKSEGSVVGLHERRQGNVSKKDEGT